MSTHSGSMKPQVKRARNWGWVKLPRTDEDDPVYVQLIVQHLHEMVMAPLREVLGKDHDALGEVSRTWSHWLEGLQGEGSKAVPCLGESTTVVLDNGEEALERDPGICKLIKLTNGSSLHAMSKGGDGSENHVYRVWSWTDPEPDDSKYRAALGQSAPLVQARDADKLPSRSTCFGRPGFLRANWAIFDAFHRCIEDEDTLGPEHYIWKIRLRKDGEKGNAKYVVSRSDTVRPVYEEYSGSNWPLPKVCTDIVRHLLKDDAKYSFLNAFVQETTAREVVERLCGGNMLACSRCGMRIEAEQNNQVIVEEGVGAVCRANCPGGTAPKLDAGEAMSEVGMDELGAPDPFGSSVTTPSPTSDATTTPDPFAGA